MISIKFLSLFSVCVAAEATYLDYYGGDAAEMDPAVGEMDPAVGEMITYYGDEENPAHKSASGDQSPWEGVACGGLSGATDVCQPGLEGFLQDPTDPNSIKRCCLKGSESTYDDCKCLPCGMPCDSTESAQKAAKDAYINQMKYSEADAEAASKTYMCADSIFWQVDVPKDVKPVFKCCVNVDGDNHQCNCPKKDETKSCYSKWSNPDLYKCDFGPSNSGVHCCRDSSKNCKPDQGAVEGFSDWAGCWGSSQTECETKAKQTRQSPDNKDITQTSGCVYDVMPIQKYCGIEVTDDTQCQDPRANFIDNNCGLNAVSDTEWFVNANSDLTGLKYTALQGIQGAAGYCGTHWLPKSGQPVVV